MSRHKQNRNDDHPRLQKVLAAAGLGSRRNCENLIVDGRVEIDRVVVTKLGTRVDSSTQTIRVDGIPLKQPCRCYFAVHKPAGVLSTSKDQWGRAPGIFAWFYRVLSPCSLKASRCSRWRPSRIGDSFPTKSFGQFDYWPKT